MPLRTLQKAPAAHKISKIQVQIIRFNRQIMAGSCQINNIGKSRHFVAKSGTIGPFQTLEQAGSLF
jgi:hypothetical protein